MRAKLSLAFALSASFFTVRILGAQDLDPNIRKISDGIYVYVGKNFSSNCGIVITQEGVVLIDSGHNPTDSRAVLDAVKKLSPLPIRFLLDTEPHPDHTTGHFVFSPPATIVAHQGATESMVRREKETPGRIEKLAGTSPEMRKALEGYRGVVAEGTGVVLGVRHRRRADQYSSTLRNHSRYLGRVEDDESFKPRGRRSRARPARHREDFRRHGKILRAAGGARRQNGQGGKITRRNQERAQNARVRQVGESRTLSDQRGSGVQSRERQLIWKEDGMKFKRFACLSVMFYLL